MSTNLVSPLVGIWRLALPTPLSKCFDYLPCISEGVEVTPGMRIKVPFGARELVGVLLEIVVETTIEPTKLKSALEILDQTPTLDAELLALCHWMSDYYQHPIGEVVKAVLPKYLRSTKPIPKLPKATTTPVHSDVALTLNEEQQVALNAINREKRFAVFLLAGVTGSGKTEVYLQAIADVLQRGEQALVLVPEISLTPQTLARFQQRFGDNVAVMHSALTDRARASAWLAAKNGRASIVIGTRSAVFAPLPKLALIVVDEEHDLSFKSQSQLRYSARDVAVMRARRLNIPIILGSATPALESYHNALQQRYTLLVLSQRAGSASLPNVRVIDLRRQTLKAGLSAPLLKAIAEQLARKKQVLLFINRRGYAPVMLCHQCGYVVCCTQCDAKVTLHNNPQRLICHHCDRAQAIIRICPHCHQTDLMSLGQGTEQIESVLAELFPQHKVLRVDRDTANTKAKLEEKMAAINACEVDILVGTQMLAKGHHFPNVGLCAIIEADSGFYSADFRALEHLSQLIVQVAGRAGRVEERGEVIIQTHEPHNPYLELLLQKGYAALARQLLTQRQRAELPPFSYQALLRAEARQAKLPQEFLRALKASSHFPAAKVLGPVPANLTRRAGKFRFQLLIQANSRKALKACVTELCAQAALLPSARQVRWLIDVDPVETL